MLSKLTLIGLDNYSEGAIWNKITLPTGMDKDILINEILRQGGEFCVIYPDPDFLADQIGFFFKKWLHNFDKWWKAYNTEYEALFNVDVKTTREEEGNNEENSASEGRNATTSTRLNNSKSSGSGNDQKAKAAYDASTFQPVESNSLYSSASSSESASESLSSNNSESMTATQEHTIKIEEYKRGNQGITMSQEMLLSEFNAWRFNIYYQIADIFVSEFCVVMYC